MLGAIIGAAASIYGGIKSRQAARRAEREARKERARAKAEMERQKYAFSRLDTSNPYLNMENVYEDLTVNQQQAQFMAQQTQQQQANLLEGLRGAAGGSGIASLAQSIAQKGQLAAQQASAMIGQQESANQRAAAQGAAMRDRMEREGEKLSRDMEQAKVSSMLGMSQGELYGANQRLANARANAASSSGNIASGIATGIGALAGSDLFKDFSLSGLFGGGMQTAGSGGGLSGMESQSQLEFMAKFGYTPASDALSK